MRESRGTTARLLSIELVLATGLALVLRRPSSASDSRSRLFVVQEEVLTCSSGCVRPMMRSTTTWQRRRWSGRRQDEGSLAFGVAPNLPFRIGLRGADPPQPQNRCRHHPIRVVRPPQTTIRQPMPAVPRCDDQLDPGCRPAILCVDSPRAWMSWSCGSDGAFSTFTITAVAPPRLALRHNGEDSPALSCRQHHHPDRHTYLLPSGKGRPTAAVGAIRRRYSPDVAVIDMSPLWDSTTSGIRRPQECDAHSPMFDGPGRPMDRRRPQGDMKRAAGYCGVQLRVSSQRGTLATPRFPALGGAGGALVRLPPAVFADGPWCPDDTAPNRFDADSLKVRSVGVSLRIESALAALRGPAGTLLRAPARRPSPADMRPTSRSISG